MKRIPLLAFMTLALCALAAAQSVAVTRHKVIYRRPKPIQNSKRTFTVVYPKIRASTPALSKKIEDTVSYKRIMDVDVNEEIKEVQWLESADYRITYNRNGALELELFVEGSGAYPDGSTKFVIADLASGERVTPAASFTDLSGLAAMVKRDQKKEIDKAIIAMRKDPELKDPDPAGMFESTEFTSDDLDWFSFTDRGVTFHYDYGFPHVIQAAQPPGQFFFSWKRLKPFIRSGSLLSRIAR
jgi:hypothetical protein